MLLKSAGSEARLSGFKTIALSLLDGLLWENYLTILSLNFLTSYTGMVIFPTSRVIVKLGKGSVCETLRTVPSNGQCPIHVSYYTIIIIIGHLLL